MSLFEHKSQAVIPLSEFRLRMLRFGLFSAALLAGALGIGILGYRWTEQLSWIDSLLNASMILSGMGPANTMVSDSGKIFASVYALFSGIVFISSAGIMVSPVFHRIIHRLHAEVRDEDGE